ADYRPKKSKQNSKNSKLCDEGSSDNSVSVGEDVSRRKSVLHSVKWDRIILDEASHTFTDSCIMLLFSSIASLMNAHSAVPGLTNVHTTSSGGINILKTFSE
ncbi:hypothetical protein H5410_064964, partial [Solanum commersonii]